MKPLDELQILGYEFALEGHDVRLRWHAEGKPDPAKVKPLLQEIRSNKDEVVRHLQAEKIASLSLDEFKNGFCAVRVWSEALDRELWIVSNEKAAQELGV